MADIKSYFPDILKEVKEFKLIDEAESPELLFLWEETEKIFNNQFIVTSDETGVKMIEDMLGLKPKATDTLQERKFKILTKYNEDIPYTIGKLNEVLATLCGKNGFKLEINRNAFYINVKVELVNKKNVDAVNETLERMVPANMLFDITLLYNQHKTLYPYTHFHLKKYKHRELREEAINFG